ncbi:MAG: NADH-quinone oxidoreductase subunit N [Chloroflexi bacterium]|nr:NADH-quinone oxidoreductase subunit N [Chloroflexota bacterium]
MPVNFHLFWPEFLVTGLAFLVLTVDFLLPAERKNLLAGVAVVGLAAILAFTLWFLWGVDEALYGGIFYVDGYALFFKAFFLVLGGVIILSSVDFVKKYLTHPGEYYGIVLFSVVGMMLMAASGELLTAFIALELESFALYVLTAYARENAKSNEAGLKYILLGAFSSALLLYGISLIYGTLGVTRYQDISQALTGLQGFDPLLAAGLILILAGLGFKVAAVPFHMWAPDVYEGAPLPITAYIAVGSKVAVFALVLRLFAQGFLPAIDQWQLMVAILAALTMTVGNLVALAQKNIKRLLAYSSIGQVGYLLVGVAALSPLASNAIMLHLVGYAATNLAAFLVIIAFYNYSAKEEVPDFAGLADRAPFLAISLAAALFSLAGLPFFAGFTTKFYLFAAAAKEGFLWLVGVAVVNSLISLYYYLVVIKQMYIQPATDPTPVRVPVLVSSVLAVLVLGVFLIGIYPGPLVNAIGFATRVVLP